MCPLKVLEVARLQFLLLLPRTQISIHVHSVLLVDHSGVIWLDLFTYTDSRISLSQELPGETGWSLDIYTFLWKLLQIKLVESIVNGWLNSKSERNLCLVFVSVQVEESKSGRSSGHRMWSLNNLQYKAKFFVRPSKV